MGNPPPYLWEYDAPDVYALLRPYDHMFQFVTSARDDGTQVHYAALRLGEFASDETVNGLMNRLNDAYHEAMGHPAPTRERREPDIAIMRLPGAERNTYAQGQVNIDYSLLPSRDDDKKRRAVLKALESALAEYSPGRLIAEVKTAQEHYNRTQKAIETHLPREAYAYTEWRPHMPSMALVCTDRDAAERTAKLLNGWGDKSATHGGLINKGFSIHGPDLPPDVLGNKTVDLKGKAWERSPGQVNHLVMPDNFGPVIAQVLNDPARKDVLMQTMGYPLAVRPEVTQSGNKTDRLQPPPPQLRRVE